MGLLQQKVKHYDLSVGLEAMPLAGGNLPNLPTAACG